MIDIQDSASSHVMRVDTINVPQSAKTDFLVQVKAVMDLVRTQPGFVRSEVLEQVDPAGDCCFITMTEWKRAEDRDGAGAAVAAMQRARDFDPQAFRQQRSITAETRAFRPLHLV